MGIGLGAKLSWRFPRSLYALEILTGLYALAFPVAARWLTDWPGLARITSSPALTVTATALVLLGPSLLIGCTVPLLSAYQKSFIAGRPAFGSIYLAYNLGALLGIVAVEFFLVRLYGHSVSLRLLGSLNILNGLILRVLTPGPGLLVQSVRKTFLPSEVLGLALASLASAMFQMFFFKLCYHLFLPNRENFAVGLLVSLAGMVVGTALATKLRLHFATYLILAALLLAAVYAAYPAITEGFVHLEEASDEWPDWLWLACKVAVAAGLALGPMAFFGASLPALMHAEEDVAGESGHLLYVSSLANAAGYLLYVCGGHAAFSNGVWIGLTGVLALLAALISVRFHLPRLQAILAPNVALLLVLVAARWSEPHFYVPRWAGGLSPAQTVRFFKSGADSATLIQSETSSRISYNGHPSVWVTSNGRVNLSEMISGVIPALCAPRADRALVLGLGSGITAGAAAQAFARTDIVEINGAFYLMMPALRHANLNLDSNPKADLHLGDGRAFLSGRHAEYDAIINSIPAPSYFSASKIYTVEFYERVARALKPDGTFSTWLAIPNMTERGVKTILSALARNFRYAELRVIGPSYYMATCSNRPIRCRRFSDLAASDLLAAQLSRNLPTLSLDEFFEDLRLSDNLFEHFPPGREAENTDNHPVLEFMGEDIGRHSQSGVDVFLDMPNLLTPSTEPGEEAGNPRRLVLKAGVFYVIDQRWFSRYLLPRLQRDPASLEAWRSWLRELAAAHGVLEERNGGRGPRGGPPTRVRIKPRA